MFWGGCSGYDSSWQEIPYSAPISFRVSWETSGVLLIRISRELTEIVCWPFAERMFDGTENGTCWIGRDPDEMAIRCGKIVA